MFGYISQILIITFKLHNKAYATVTRDSFGKKWEREMKSRLAVC